MGLKTSSPYCGVRVEPAEDRVKLKGPPVRHGEVENLRFLRVSCGVEWEEMLRNVHDWLVVWNMFYFYIYWEESSELPHIFSEG